MSIPWTSLSSLEDTTYYDCVSRCDRSPLFPGDDKFPGKSYEHRRHWVKHYLKLVDITDRVIRSDEHSAEGGPNINSSWA